MHSHFSPGKTLYIIGAGGFGREVYCLYLDVLKALGEAAHPMAVFVEEDAFWKERMVLGIPVIRMHEMQPGQQVVVAIAGPEERRRIVNELSPETDFATLIHPTAVLSEWVSVGKGSIICAGAKLTCNITLGRHTHLNLNTTVGHDTTADDFLTTAPGAAVSGNCTIGRQVYIGSNAAIREKLHITDHVTIGMGGIVVKHIEEAGVYAGNPVKKIS